MRVWVDPADHSPPLRAGAVELVGEPDGAPTWCSRGCLGDARERRRAVGTSSVVGGVRRRGCAAAGVPPAPAGCRQVRPASIETGRLHVYRQGPRNLSDPAGVGALPDVDGDGTVHAMASWSDFAAAAPTLAARVQALLDAHIHKTIATLRKDGSPRISGTETTLRDGELCIGSMWQALKAKDLQRDPRFALHTGSDDPDKGWPGDAKLAGVARRSSTRPRSRTSTARPPPTARATCSGSTSHEVSTVGLNEAKTHLVIDIWTPETGAAHDHAESDLAPLARGAVTRVDHPGELGRGRTRRRRRRCGPSPGTARRPRRARAPAGGLRTRLRRHARLVGEEPSASRSPPCRRRAARRRPRCRTA